MLTGLNHLTLAVSDLQRSLAFYRDVLQLRVEARGTPARICRCRGCGCVCRWIHCASPSRALITRTTPSVWKARTLRISYSG